MKQTEMVDREAAMTRKEFLKDSYASAFVYPWIILCGGERFNPRQPNESSREPHGLRASLPLVLRRLSFDNHGNPLAAAYAERREAAT
jgi:hypothetical protein